MFVDSMDSLLVADVLLPVETEQASLVGIEIHGYRFVGRRVNIDVEMVFRDRFQTFSVKKESCSMFRRAIGFRSYRFEAASSSSICCTRGALVFDLADIELNNTPSSK